MGNKEQMVKIHQYTMKNQKKALIDKACEWIKENMPKYINFEEGFIYEVDMADDFRKAMEG
jgi:hypothetical protein